MSKTLKDSKASKMQGLTWTLLMSRLDKIYKKDTLKTKEDIQAIIIDLQKIHGIELSNGKVVKQGQ